MGTAEGMNSDMKARFVPVSTQDDVERLLAASSDHPVVLFKHDHACSISVRAYWDLSSVPGEISLIDVERDHGLSQAVATRLGVRHESPQVIVIRDGQAVYSASHWNIESQAVTRAAGADHSGTAFQSDSSTG